MPHMRRTFRRYERVYHAPSRRYLTAIAPGPTFGTVLVDDRGAIFPISREHLRSLRWYERLLCR